MPNDSDAYSKFNVLWVTAWLHAQFVSVVDKNIFKELTLSKRVLQSSVKKRSKEKCQIKVFILECFADFIF